MCDCYQHKCDDKKCNEYIPIHIGDFCTDRDNLEVLCPRHMPKRFKDFDGAIFKWEASESASEGINDKSIPKGYRCSIRIKDIKKVDKDRFYPKDNIDSIHPNSLKAVRIKDYAR